jgi:hypothetical protein
VVSNPPGIVHVPVRAGEIMLSTLMDSEDAERLGARGLSLGSHGYAQLYWEKHVMLVHRWILGLQRGDRRIGDHINGDPLDNRRANLRAVSPSGSSQNVSGHGRSGYRGVYPAPYGRWQVKVKVAGVSHYLGAFATREEAALAADAKRRELMADYAGIRSASTGSGGARRRTMAERARRRAAADAIRAWARSQGFAVGDIGRVPVRIVTAYESRTEREAS